MKSLTLAILAFFVVGARSQTSSPSGPTVDLGYARFRGSSNGRTGISSFLGIPFAAPPVGNLRFQAPQPPLNRSDVVDATTFGNQCPQVNANNAASSVTTTTQDSSEDCLFLNVYTPTNVLDSNGSLPVLVWIHGGGFGAGSGTSDPSYLLSVSNNSFVAVLIQYRLGPFGFLASPEVKAKGVLNPGLLDQQYALQWVKNNIHFFGGNSSHVTIWGQSAGGGSVILQAVAKGGQNGESLFQGAIASSPYIAPEWGYNDSVPMALYQVFAQSAGCYPSSDVFHCLVDASFSTLQYASQEATRQVPAGTWAFLPVIDDSFLPQEPSQLLSGDLNGKYILAGHNANEGSGFVPQNISTQFDLTMWASLMFPFLNSSTWDQLQQIYPDPQDTNLYTSQQERADLMYSENAFVCPSYWLVQGYPSGNAWHFQFSTPPAVHSSDVQYYFGTNGRPPRGQQTFAYVFSSAFANFIVNWDPTIPIAPSGNTYNGTFYGTSWPAYRDGQGNNQVDFNVTSGGSPDITAIDDVDNFAAGVQGRCQVWRNIMSTTTNSTAGTSSAAPKMEVSMISWSLYFVMISGIIAIVL